MSKFENSLLKKSILIVEDESILALGMEYSLEEFGYEVTGIETNFHSAIKHAKEFIPDLVIMDINLKGEKTGIDAAKCIWEEYHIPIIFLTSYSDDKTIKSAMNSEPYAYLIKPCREKELKATIETSLHKHNYFFKNKQVIDDTCNTNILLKYQFCFNKTKGVLFDNHKPITLTQKEIKLFELLTTFINESVSFDRISDYVWREPLLDISKLRSLIYRLKKKIGIDLFENVYEFGYKLKSR